MKIGTKVKTGYGIGIVIGYDLPNSTFERAKRLIVKFNNGVKICYFLHEVKQLKP